MGIWTKDQTGTKSIHLRATPRQESLIKVAAQRQGVNVTDSVLKSACEKAEQTNADRNHFGLDKKQWDLFMKALDEPPRVIPEIKKLFSGAPIAKSR